MFQLNLSSFGKIDIDSRHNLLSVTKKKAIEGCLVADDTPLHLTQIFRSLWRNLSIFANLGSGVLSLSPRSGKSLVDSQQKDERWQLFPR